MTSPTTLGLRIAILFDTLWSPAHHNTDCTLSLQQSIGSADMSNRGNCTRHKTYPVFSTDTSGCVETCSPRQSQSAIIKVSMCKCVGQTEAVKIILS